MSFRMTISQVEHCPGLYCARMPPPASPGNCTACPRGWRAIDDLCHKCEESPSFYDWLYLGFMALLCFSLHCFFIDFTSKRKSFARAILATHVSAFVECAGAAIVTVLVAPPRGHLALHSCGVVRLSDWYTLFHNPKPWYAGALGTVHCTNEAVYPLYTLVFIYNALCLLLLLLLRPAVVRVFSGTQASSSAIYAALYFIPILTVIHAVFCGLLYYSFPYIVVVVSVVTIATHFAIQLDQSMQSLLWSCVTDKRNMAVILGHWLLHAYGIIAITELTNPAFHCGLIALVPLPAIFYIVTVNFTDPEKLLMT
ncbi:PREDICTED: JNK1/MAPK8-associated membrane protein-like [Priapulus caudatus]|uniref:JNK1/MAPK8-associated membrane protein-like n=1 Tax=Priapulus caudatus TaxID=37621 RepID=A0ABM1E057_PRICU|nr:PREDICTED: JNK1/MAPK8-associated membrane protein-like [Priapulus caudatus]XP_014665578.1 PREDICTED: JNK1/MAPK8-associated membrane protein-like [Priapulus caudatus]